MLKRLLLSALISANPALSDVNVAAEACLTEQTAHSRSLGGEILGYTVRDPNAEYHLTYFLGDKRHKIREAGFIFRMRDAHFIESECIYWNSRKLAGMRYPLDTMDAYGTTDFDHRSGKVFSGRYTARRWGIYNGRNHGFSPRPFNVVLKPGASIQVVFNVHSQKNLYVLTHPLDATLKGPSGAVIQLNEYKPSFKTFTQVSGDYVLEVTNTEAIPVSTHVHLQWDQ